MGLFGTSGVRGVTGKDITSGLVERIACGFVRELDRCKSTRRLCVAHDTRESAEGFAAIAAEHVASHGRDCDLLGVQPAGVICNHIVASRCDGGIFVTGSHLPEGHIGIILLDSEAGYVGGETAERIEGYMTKRCKPQKRSGKRVESSERAIDGYIDLVKHLFPRKTRSHVAIDPCCGSAAVFANGLMREVCGLKVSAINDCRSHRFPRDPEPRAGSTLGLQRYVKKVSARFGAAFDIDADRVLLIDEDGVPVPEDVTGVLLAKHTLRKGESCTAPINSNSLIEEICKKMGVRFEYCGIGQPKIVAKMREIGASYAYEESGKYYVKHQPFACGILTALTVAEILVDSGRPLSEHVGRFPRTFMFKKGFECEDRIKKKAMCEVLERWDDTIEERPAKELTLEGMKKVYGDGSWVMVRASGTEPKMRIYLQGKTERRKDTLAARADGLVKGALERARGAG